MASTVSTLRTWRPISSLVVAGSLVCSLLYGAASVGIDAWEADAQIQQLQDDYRTARAEQSKSAAVAERTNSPAPGQGLVTIDSGAALALLQQTLQRLVAAPAKLESLHSLDTVQWQGFEGVRASFRIRDLPPDEVLAMIHRMEASRPAIVFDEVRVSIHARPPAVGSAPPGAVIEDDSAELSGVVLAYARPAETKPASLANGPQP